MFSERHRVALLVLAAGLPVVWCAIAERVGDDLTTTGSALVLVLLVVAASATGDRVAGLLAALSGAAWFDFFLTAPFRTFAIRDADDVEVALLLVLVGVAVTEIALWGRRQQAASSARGGYLDGVATSSLMAAGIPVGRPLVDEVAASITTVLDVDDCRFVAGDGSASTRAVLGPDGPVSLHGRTLAVERQGLPTMEETALPAGHHGVELGRFLITASTDIARPTLEQRRVAVLLANVAGADLAVRSLSRGPADVASGGPPAS